MIPRGILKSFLKNVYMKMQVDEPKEITEDDRLALSELDRYFRPFNQRLAAELQIDLAVWE